MYLRVPEQREDNAQSTHNFPLLKISYLYYGRKILNVQTIISQNKLTFDMRSAQG